MFLDKYVNRYSYNILSVLGYLELVFFLIATHPYAYDYCFLGKGDSIFAIALISTLLILINVIVLIIILIIILLENKFQWCIKKEFWIKNIFIKFMLHLGFFLWLSPFIYLVFDIIFN